MGKVDWWSAFLFDKINVSIDNVLKSDKKSLELLTILKWRY